MTRVRPYAGLASCYDRLVGAALLPVVRASFEHCVRRLGLSFRSVADVGCGTGSFLKYLSRYRVPLIGVDRAPEMLQIAARRLRGADVLLSCQDMRCLRLPSSVDLITCNGDTLNYMLKDEDLVRALRACHQNLSPRGHLVVDLLTGVPPKSLATLPSICVRGGGSLSCWSAQIDRRRALTRVELTLGRRETNGWNWSREIHVQKWRPLGTLIRMFEDASLDVIDRVRLSKGDSSSADGAWVKLVARTST